MKTKRHKRFKIKEDFGKGSALLVQEKIAESAAESQPTDANLEQQVMGGEMENIAEGAKGKSVSFDISHDDDHMS